MAYLCDSLYYSKRRISHLILLNSVHQVAMLVTYIKVGSSMFQDELGGVRLVLTVVDIHLELISLGRRNDTSKLFHHLSIVLDGKQPIKKNVVLYYLCLVI